MSSGIEREIQSLLQNVGDPSLVADELLKKWHRDELSEEDLERVSHFLITFGFHAALAENLAHKLKTNFKIPWSAVVRLIEVLNSKPSKEVVDSIFTGATEQDSLDQLIRFPQLASIDSRFGEVRTQHLDERRRQIHQQTEQLLNEAKNKIHRQKLQERDYFLKKKIAPSAEEKKLAQDFAEKLKKKIKKSPSLAYDGAIALFQMGHAETALETLKMAKDSPEVAWLEVDLLLETRRFIDALTKLDSMEKQYASDPESTPALTYARAQALWGLQQSQAAIDLLQSLVRVKPDYRSASALLQHWREGFK